MRKSDVNQDDRPYMTPAEFATNCGVPKGELQAAYALGIVEREKGRYYLDHPSNRLYLQKCHEDQEEERRKRAERTNMIDLQNIDLLDPEALANRVPHNMLARVKDIQTVRKTELALQEKRGELIQRSVVTRFTSRVWSIHGTEFKTFAAFIAPLLAAEFNIKSREKIAKVEQMVDVAMHRRLESVRRALVKYLEDEDGDDAV